MRLRVTEATLAQSCAATCDRWRHFIPTHAAIDVTEASILTLVTRGTKCRRDRAPPPLPRLCGPEASFVFGRNGPHDMPVNAQWRKAFFPQNIEPYRLRHARNGLSHGSPLWKSVPTVARMGRSRHRDFKPTASQHDQPPPKLRHAIVGDLQDVH